MVSALSGRLATTPRTSARPAPDGEGSFALDRLSVRTVASPRHYPVLSRTGRERPVERPQRSGPHRKAQYGYSAPTPPKAPLVTDRSHPELSISELSVSFGGLLAVDHV